MQEAIDSSSLAYLFGFIWIMFGILMFFGSHFGEAFGGLMCAIAFGILGGAFVFYGYVLSRKR